MRGEVKDGLGAGELRDAVALLAAFLGTAPLTEVIAGLERDLEGTCAGDAGPRPRPEASVPTCWWPG
ncbi:hypothetical protein [Streptomyces sp. NPDC051286]|uniref:hypothetical protein n=1 Tax=Streptomyces sp. NPDC051286 TaxID=3365647 RepID=UPI0037A59362